LLVRGPRRSCIGLIFLWALFQPGRNVVAAESVGGVVLGTYERTALDLALGARGLKVDPAPEGKRVGRIVVVNHEVFGPDDGHLQLLNYFHRTTRESIIEREVLLRPGDFWDETVAQETRRRLTHVSFTTLVVVAPVQSASPGTIDLLIVTRDVWSLRLNSNFEYQNGVLSLLELQPSENNFLGRRKQLAVIYDLDLGRYAIGPGYHDSNIRGSRWTLSAGARLLFGRQSDQLEGSSSSASLRYPLWSYKRRWGFGVGASHFVGTSRRFSGVTLVDSAPALCTYSGNANVCDADPGRGVPVRYRTHYIQAGSDITRSFGQTVIQRVSLGYGFSGTRRDLFSDDFLAHPELRAGFLTDVLPRTERVSAFSMSYELFLPDFVRYRDLGTYDFPEDVSMGPSAGASASYATPVLGSTREFWRFSGSVGWRVEIGQRGLLAVSAAAGTRLQEGESLDRNRGAELFFATPQFLRVLRLVTRFETQRLSNNRANARFSIGGDTGLRGYPIGVFQGEALVRGNVEMRSSGWAVGFIRMGGVAFWDFGHVAAYYDAIDLHHDVGVGWRVVIPQLQSTVIRVDWAVALQDVSTGNGVLRTSGFPGRLSAGFAQPF
jgi:hypothetical protein